jgi:hypothetical protein
VSQLSTPTGKQPFAADAHRDDKPEDDKRHRSDYLDRFFAAQILGHAENLRLLQLNLEVFPY